MEKRRKNRVILSHRYSDPRFRRKKLEVHSIALVLLTVKEIKQAEVLLDLLAFVTATEYFSDIKKQPALMTYSSIKTNCSLNLYFDVATKLRNTFLFQLFSMFFHIL